MTVLRFVNSRHAYYFDGKRATSVSTVAKIPDDTFALEAWRKRQVAIGLAMSPDLVERVAAHYDDKAVIDDLADQALERAGAMQAAGRGTAAHRIAERVDLGEPIIETPLAVEVTEAWKKALADAGLRIVPAYIERIVGLPNLNIWGRFDRVVSDGTYLYVLDLKTGAAALRYPHSVAVQLALYANATVLAGDLSVVDGTGDVVETESFESWPPAALNLRTAYVLHLTPNGAKVVPINIEAGWQTFTSIIIPTLKWRKRRDLVGSPLTAQAYLGTISGLQEALAPAPGRDVLLSWLQSFPPAALQQVTEQWPAGVPTFRGDPDEQGLRRIYALMRSVADTVPECPPDPTQPVPAPDTTPEIEAPEDDAELPPEITDTSSGTSERSAEHLDATWLDGDDEMVTQSQLEQVRASYQSLGPLQSVIDQWVKESQAHGFDFGNLREHPTARRIALSHAAIAMARAFDGDEELTRACISTFMPLHSATTVGHLIGALTREQAQDCCALALAYIETPSMVKFGPSGRATFVSESGEVL